MKKQLMTILVCIFMIAVGFIALMQNQKAETDATKKRLPAFKAGLFPPIFFIQTPDQSKDKGIGPVKDITLGPIDQKMVNAGKTIFTGKCTVCHSLDQKIIGPPLRNITKTRTPEYIMNMILNPTNMEKEDPVTKALHKQYVATPMTNQNFTQDQARALLEYLRSVAK